MTIRVSPETSTPPTPQGRDGDRSNDFRHWCEDHFGPVQRSSETSYKTICPHHPDKNPSLNITLRDDDVILLHCHAGCENKDILDEVGLTLKDLYVFQTPGSFVPSPPDPLTPDDLPTQVALRREVYRVIFDTLSLSEKHRDDLRRRGLSDEDIDRNQYRTLLPKDTHPVNKALWDQFHPDDLMNVPGIYKGLSRATKVF